MKSLAPILVLGSSLLSSVLATGNPATFWSDYPTCEDACHQSVWNSQSCSLANSCSCAGCLCLADSCLCETSSWLTAVAQCIGEQCGSSGVIDAAGIASSACAKNGHPLVLPSASLVSIGLAALPAATTQGQAPASSATGGNVATAGTVAITDTPTSATSQAVSAGATRASFSAVGANPATTSDGSVSSAGTPAANASSGLSTGAKAGIGIGAALAVVIILSLLAFIFYQRRRHHYSKANNGAPPAEGRAETTGLFELAGAGRAASGAEKKDLGADADGKRAELQGGGKSPVSPAGGGGVVFPEKGRMEYVAEMPTPLSVEEKQELERRRRAAELSAELQIPLEPGIDERNELEARRKVYEIGSSS